MSYSASSMRKVFDIPGGVHPPESKEQSLQLPLGPVLLPQRVVLPLSQHIGAPAKAIVAVGEKVRTGQLIAEPQGLFSVGLHASISGTVSAIEDRPIPHTSGMNAECIVIESDGLDEWVALDECEDYTALERDALMAKIRTAGLAGMGGAGFPSAIKLNPRADDNIDTLIINGTECEPYITADDTLMREQADAVIQGTLLLAHLLGDPSTVLIGVEDNKPTAITALKKAAAAIEGQCNIEIVDFPTKYPSGGEKQLIQILTGIEVGSGDIPASLGIVCHNVGTAVAAWEAVRYGRPLISRITTVVGEALDTQRNVEVRIGTLISEVLEQNGFNADEAARLIMGGPMMGFALQDADVPIVKTSNCILAPSKQEMPEPPPAQACIRCGMCAEACPASLLPQQLFWYSQSEDYDRLQAHNLMDCIECGACSFVCPSNIPLVQYYRASKGAIKQAAVDKQKSDRSRERFEFRQARLDKAEAEKEAKRQARKQAAAEAKKLAAEKKEQELLHPTATPVAAEPTAAAPAVVADPEAEKAKLERALSSAQNRLDKARDRVDNAEPERRDKMAARVKEAELKVLDAQNKLEQFNSADSTDPVDAAIARAKAKAALPPQAKLKSNIETLQKRMTIAADKLSIAKTEGAATVDALQTGLDKMQGKIAKLQQELIDLGPEPALEVTIKAEATPDPAAAAIERAKAKAVANANMSPADKLHDQIASIEKRIAKTTEKVAVARAEGSGTADALQLGLDKMTAKLNKARADLCELEPELQHKSALKDEPASEPDAASAAIAKAKAKAAATATMSPEEKLRDQITSMQTRIVKTTAKVTAARAEGSDITDALQLGLDKMTAKLEKAKSDLAELSN